jgi:hypothetical protein
LANEPVDFKEKLNEWLPETGQWRICWRGSKHGWEASKFHNQCNEKIPTLVIIKVVKNDINFIFGGYSTETWAGGKFEFIMVLHSSFKIGCPCTHL